MSNFTLKGEPNPKQKLFFLSDKKYVAYGGARGGGKATPLWSKVLTPTGYRLMGDLKVGDEVLNAHGKPTKIIQIHPQGKVPYYKFELKNGAKCYCTADHLWYSFDSDVLLTTEQIKEDLDKGNRHRIPLYKPTPYMWEDVLSITREDDYIDECQCITIQDPQGLYITDDFIITHNSWAMRRKMVLRRLNYPGSHGLLLRRTYPELLKNHVLPLQAELAQLPGMKYNQKDRVFTFPNGSMLFLGYCDTENDVHQYQGQEFADIGFEEATHFTEYMVQQIGLSCRNTTGVPTRQYFTANPGGVGHAWFKRLFVSRDYKETEDESDYDFIQALIYDNKILMETDPDYIKSLKNLPEMQRRAFLEGDWDVFEGQFFTEWTSQKHVEKAFDIPKYWERFICVDWGYNDPHAVYWNAMSPDGRLYTYRESYRNKVLATDLARDISKINQHYGENINYIVMSPDAWAKRGGGESIADCFLAEGLPIRKADNDRLNGWMRMREWMKDAPDGKPAWIIFDNCKNLIRTIPEAPYDEHKVEDVSSTCEDHAIESMRYGLMSRPPLTYFDIPSVRRDKFDHDFDEEDEEPERTVWM